MIPGLDIAPSTCLEPESTKFEDKLHGKEDGEDDVQDVEESRVARWLAIKLHCQAERVDQNHGKDGVLEERRGDKGPELVLDRVLGNVASHWLSIEGKFDAVALKWKNFLTQF